MSGVGREDDRAELLELKHRYCRLVDEKAWESLRALFLPDAVFEMPLWGRSRRREEAIAHYAERMGRMESVHTVFMPIVEWEGDDGASVDWRMEDWLYEDGQLRHGFGEYHDRFRRVAGRWLFTAIRLDRMRVDVSEA